MSVLLRSAANADAEAVANILISSRLAFMSYAPAVHSDEEISYWVREILIPAGGVTVAVDGQKVLGVLALSTADAITWIDQLYVHPDWVGHGIGYRLLQHALDTRLRPIRLQTFQANVGARRFYERHGFRVIALTDGQDNEEHCPDVLYELR